MNLLTGTLPYLFLVVFGDEAAAAAKDFLGGGTMLQPASWTGPISFAIIGSSTRGGEGVWEGAFFSFPLPFVVGVGGGGVEDVLLTNTMLVLTPCPGG